jgi:hypothetical protein
MGERHTPGAGDQTAQGREVAAKDGEVAGHILIAYLIAYRRK